MKKILTTIILTFIIFIILLYPNVVSAYNLELTLSADKSDVVIGDEVTITLTLSKGMQAADFTINYDSNLLEFESSSLSDNFYTTKDAGKIKCSWFDTTDTYCFTFSFIAISSGTAKFTTTTENFYDENLQSASLYNEGNLNVTLLASSSALNETNNSANTLNINDNIQNNSNTVQTIEQIAEENQSSTVESTVLTNNELTENLSSTYNNSLLTSNSDLPQTGSTSSLIILILFSIMLIAIFSKIKLNQLRDI